MTTRWRLWEPTHILGADEVLNRRRMSAHDADRRGCRVPRVCALEMLQSDSAGDAHLTIGADHLDDERTLLERTTPRRPMAQELCKDYAHPDVPRTQASMGGAVEPLCLVEIYA